MAKISSTVTMREFNLRLSERELCAILDLMNWNSDTIKDHIGLCSFESFGDTDECVKVLKVLHDVFYEEYEKE